MNSDSNLLDGEKWENDLDAKMFGIRVNARYHQRRRMFFDRWNSVTSALVLISGSGAIINLVTKLFNSDVAVIVFGGTVTLISLVDLVVGTARMARIHEILFRQYVDLEMDLARVTSKEQLVELDINFLRICADEPPPLNTLFQLCYNDISNALGREERIVDINFLQRVLSNFLSFESPKHHVEPMLPH